MTFYPALQTSASAATVRSRRSAAPRGDPAATPRAAQSSAAHRCGWRASEGGCLAWNGGFPWGNPEDRWADCIEFMGNKCKIYAKTRKNSNFSFFS